MICSGSGHSDEGRTERQRSNRFLPIGSRVPCSCTELVHPEYASIHEQLSENDDQRDVSDKTR